MSTCDPNLSVLWENSQYATRVAYMAPAAVLYMRILYVIWVKHRIIYIRHPFFIIYSMDCVVGLFLLLLEIFTTRLLVYVPQLCPSASEFILSHPYLMDIYYTFLHYLHCAQPFIQMFLTTNRMTSVLFPVNYNKYWKSKLLLVFLIIIFAPTPFIWSAITASKSIVYFFGGFIIISASAVKTITRATFILRLIAVVITILTTSIMFYRMSKMPIRLKKSERTMCFACTINSICFVVPSFFEALATFYEPYGNSQLNYLIQPLTWDFLNVSSPVVMIFVSSQLRRHVFSLSEPQSQTPVLPIRNLTDVGAI